MDRVSESSYVEKVEGAVRFIQAARPGFKPRVGLVLGSGLGAMAGEVSDPTVLPYDEIPGFPVSGVQGHAGRLVLGQLEGKDVVVMQGRVHLYEGFSPLDAVLPARVMRLLGAEHFIITNAAGSLRPEHAPGSLMILSDHLNLQGINCLSGPNFDQWGPRFPDMTEPYDMRLLGDLMSWVREQGIPVWTGVYAGLPGPTYETPAEVKLFSIMGADAVGMSTVQETIALKHMGARVTGISCITNLAAGLSPNELSHDEVAHTADIAAPDFAKLIRRALRQI